MATPAPLSSPDRALARLSRRIGAAAPEGGWSPPPLPDLIARIDGALAARRAN